MLAKELEQAVKNKRVKSILFEVDSPGGEVGGVAEFANMIYQARQTKPIYSYATSLSASAGYWLQSATTKSYAGKTAFIGSVGVLHASYVNDNKKLIITSKYAPKKHLNAGDKDWKQGVKEKIDHLESFFHADLSRFRGVSIAHVQNEFGQGDVLNAEQALKARMIDEISTFEDVLGKLGISMEENDEIKGMLAALADEQRTSMTAFQENINALANKMGVLSNKMTAFETQNTQMQTDLQGFKAAYETLEQENQAEQERKEAITHLFDVMLAGNDPHKGRYNELKAQCLADSTIDLPKARENLIDLRSKLSNGTTPTPAGADTSMGAMPITFDAKVDELVKQGITKGKAIIQVGNQHPELYKEHIIRKQGGA